jgi:hypothetical protein
LWCVLFTLESFLIGPGGAALSAALGGAVLVSLLALRTRKARAIVRASALLGDERTRAEACRAIEHLLGPAPARATGAYRRWANLAMLAAGQAAQASAAREALGWAERIDPTGLEPAVVAVRALFVSDLTLAISHDRAEARRVLTGVPRPSADPPTERALAAHEALLDALTGDAESAEGRAKAGLAAESEPILRWKWQFARAHALASLERRDEALEVVRALARADNGELALTNLVCHAGPASPLAESLLTEGRDRAPSRSS